MNKNKWIYIILALFLGGFGIHKIYEGMWFKFIVYFVLAISFIPVLCLVPCFIAFCEAIHALFCWE